MHLNNKYINVNDSNPKTIVSSQLSVVGGLAAVGVLVFGLITRFT
jgi:hypothetical protein